MAIVETTGDFPRRIGDYVLYRRYDKILLRKKSGFTTAALKTAVRYELSRQNASEFGRVSALCKQVRIALQGILPRQNNLLIVNAFTKKMREVMTCDAAAVRGERQLATAIATAEGKALLKGYNFNPESKAVLSGVVRDGVLTVTTKGFDFCEFADYVGFRTHYLVFDFSTAVNALESGDWIFESKAKLRNGIVMPMPTMPNGIGIVFALLEVQFYNYYEGSYVPMVKDGSKSVMIVNVC